MPGSFFFHFYLSVGCVFIYSQEKKVYSSTTLGLVLREKKRRHNNLVRAGRCARPACLTKYPPQQRLAVASLNPSKPYPPLKKKSKPYPPPPHDELHREASE